MSGLAPLSPPAEEVAVVFKSKKNRKQLRNRPTADDNSNDAQPTTANSYDAPSSIFDDDDDEAAPAVRKAKRQRVMGVAFRVEVPRPEEDHSDQEAELSPPMALVPSPDGDENAPPTIAGRIKRFAPQTGIMGALVNQHMEQYVESRLSKRHPSTSESTTSHARNPSASSISLGNATATTVPPPPAFHAPVLEGQKLTQSGKLLEVDLGDEARMKNLDMIERARRGQDLYDSAGSELSNKRKRRDRRGSQDLKRDQVVESFLHENRLEVYDVPKQAENEDIGDLAADDRVAEKFRRDFIDAMSQRVRRRRMARPAAQPANRPGAKRDDEVLKGPKLGGSRNVRAQVRDILIQEAKEKVRRR
ncbi:hypothetical protein TD95_000627 [Thielaviopsis punctulata]|uniref:mRNA splicing factor RNA helicase n=1 Tax=Thielaviopsis punctulata TaxID=72032 RepID=A0A0F4ZIT4_9PEZI|nr:hypothetical protein TD95_000627 [Thielaviopsis punctulata]